MRSFQAIRVRGGISILLAFISFLAAGCIDEIEKWEPGGTFYDIQVEGVIISGVDGTPLDGASLQLAAAAFQNRELAASWRRLAQQAEALQEEVEKRTAWAEEREQARRQEEERRIRWVADLEQQLELRFAEVQAARDAFAKESEEHQRSREELQALTTEREHLQTQHEHLQTQHEHLQSEHDWALATRSWRYTRPFRVAGRMLTNLGQAGAWNPLRWPLRSS